ncbi:MAG: hypothetical protein AAGU77_10740 [Bacillota bacterium]
MGCGTAAIIFVVIAFVVVFILASSMGGIFGGGANVSSGGVTASTVEREKLAAGSVKETDYFEDNVGIIRNETTMLAGMKNFYSETGIQPFVYLTESINADPSDSELEAYTDELYSSLFEDEGHLLLVFFFDQGDPVSFWYRTGDKASTVMDSEAEDIFEDYIYRYYDTGLTAEQYFSKVFNDTADRMMSVTVSPWVYVLIVAGVVLLVVIAFVWWRHAKKQKNLEAQQTEEMLNTPLEQFGDKEAEELGKKYDDDPDNDPKT